MRTFTFTLAALLPAYTSAGCTVHPSTCYEDDAKRVLDAATYEGAVSREYCAQFCSDKGFKVAGVEYKDAPNLDVADCDAAAAGSYVTADFGQVRDLTKVVLWCVQACERATDLFFFVASTERRLLLPQYF